MEQDEKTESEEYNSMIKKQIDFVRNEILSYYNTNSRQIIENSIRSIEAFQARRQHEISKEFKEQHRVLKVIFMLPETSLWDVFAPLYQAMEKSTWFAPMVAAFERVDVSPDKTKKQILADLHEMNVEFTLLEPAGKFYPSIADLEPDIIFYTLGSVAYPPAYRIEFTSQFCLTCYISYGFLMVNELEYQFGQSFHHAAWRIFASTPREQAEYSKRSQRLTNNIFTTGYTKFDLYPRKLVPPPTKPVIIWAPHWTIGLIYPALNLGTFADICNDMIELMEQSSSIEFVFKPHPNLKYACEKTTFMSPEAYELYLRRLQEIPNVSVALDGSNINRFVNSSAMITDSVSFLAEYIPSGRPLLFLNRPDRTKFSETGEHIIAAHYNGIGIGSIRTFIEDVAQGVDPRATNRAAVIKSQLHISDTRATDQILVNLARAFRLDQDTFLNR